MKAAAPNIVLILTDQQHWNAMSAAGNPHLRTPNMDRLLREGTLLRRAYCTSPVCGPSRMSLATGLPPHEHGYTHHFAEPWDWAQRGLTSFGHQLRAAGYSTWWVGKWHATEFVPARPDSTPGFTNLPVSLPGGRGRDFLGWDIDALWTDRAVEFLRTPPADPFFLGVSIHNPHDICFWIMNREADEIAPGVEPGDAPLPELPANFEIDPDEPEIVRFRRTVKEYGPEVQWTKRWTPHEWRRYLYAYHRLVEKADREIGRVLDALDASGRAADTLVVFTSDHGEGCAAHHMVVKLSPYDEALRVPLVFRWPGRVPAGRVIDSQLASGLDLAPTLLDYAGAPPLPRARGLSLKEVVSGAKREVRDFVVSELYPDQLQPERAARIVCTQDAKYLFAVGGPGPEEALYDLRNDPGETHNAVGDPEQGDRLIEMRGRLAAWMRETGDPLLKPFDACVGA